MPVVLEGEEKEKDGDVKAETVLLWDRKTEGGFPGTFDSRHMFCLVHHYATKQRAA